MSEAREMLVDTARAVFGAAKETTFADGWAMIADAAFPSLLQREEEGGFGGDWGDLFAVARLAGEMALALPVGESIVAAMLLARAGLDVPDGALAIAPRATGSISGGRFNGTFHAVPWGGQSVATIACFDGQLIVAHDAVVTEQGTSPAGEPRDRLAVSEGQVVPLARDPFALGAFLRVAQTAGALDAVLALAIEHANGRVQFGKPLAKLQAVQQSLATLAVEAAAVNSAGQAAALALDRDDAAFEIAAAKLRANMAIGVGAGIAHQVHGAIGFTLEYPLHMLTRRLMGWASEFGNEGHWAARLGEMALAAPGGLWAAMTARSDTWIETRQGG